MYSADSADFSLQSDDSRLLSESPDIPSSSSHTGPGGDDLSISELSLSDKPVFQKPFSLLARPNEHDASPKNDTGGEIDASEHDGTDYPEDMQPEDGAEELPEDAEKRSKLAAKLREEKLQNDLFILRKLNTSFALFKDALKESESATERVAAQLAQTDALLNKYTNILSKSEAVKKLIFDERWQGAEADEDIIDIEQREVQEKAFQEAEARALAEQRELEKREKEERGRKEQEERERKEQERKDKLASRGGGVRGVRGTRASMRAVARGASRGAPAVSRPSSVASQVDSGRVPTKRPASSASVRGPSGIARGTMSRRS